MDRAEIRQRAPEPAGQGRRRGRALDLESDAVEQRPAIRGHPRDLSGRLQRRLAPAARALIQAEPQIGHVQRLEIAADGRLAGQPAARGHPVPEQGEERGDVIGVADQMQIEPLALGRIGNGAAGAERETGERDRQLARQPRRRVCDRAGERLLDRRLAEPRLARERPLVRIAGQPAGV